MVRFQIPPIVVEGANLGDLFQLLRSLHFRLKTDQSLLATLKINTDEYL